MAWTLQAPSNVGHGELGRSIPVICRTLRPYRHGSLVFGAMQQENSVHLRGDATLPRDVSVDAIGTKRDLLILRAFNNFPVHFLAAPLVAALGAESVDRDLAAGLASYRIDSQHAALNRESSMNGVPRTPQGPMHLALGRIDPQRNLFRLFLRLRGNN